MTTFTTITNALVAVGAKPFASTVQALRDNPLAIQEGDPSAPKVQPQALRRLAFISGAAAQTQTFTGLGTYGAIEFEVFASHNGAAGGGISIAYSADGGATWSTNQLIATITSTTGAGWISGSFDFATGEMKAIATSFAVAGSSPATLSVASATLSGASLSIDGVRFQGGSANITCVAKIRPLGETA